MGSGSNRQYFSDYNGKKIDTARKKIQQWKKYKKIGEELYFFLLSSLIESADLVANTASVYGAYLKRLKSSARKKMILKPADFLVCGDNHVVFQEDSNSLIRQIEGDILYIDPPYNHRQYGANYHILNTIALYDDFVPKGKTGVREYKSSKYCRKTKAAGALEELIREAKFRYIFLSYNSEGVIPRSSIEDIMCRYGECSFKVKEHKRFRRENSTDKKSIFEYLYILVK